MQSLFEDDADESSCQRQELRDEPKPSDIIIKQEVLSEDESPTTFYQKPLTQPLQARKRKVSIMASQSSAILTTSVCLGDFIIDQYG